MVSYKPAVGDKVTVRAGGEYYGRKGTVSYVSYVLADVTFEPYGLTTAFHFHELEPKE